MTATNLMTVALETGERIGAAIARDVLADELPTAWTGLDPQDGDQLTAAGVEPGTAEWDAAESAAEGEYRRRVQSAR